MLKSWGYVWKSRFTTTIHTQYAIHISQILSYYRPHNPIPHSTTGKRNIFSDGIPLAASSTNIGFAHHYSYEDVERKISTQHIPVCRTEIPATGTSDGGPSTGKCGRSTQTWPWRSVWRCPNSRSLKKLAFSAKQLSARKHTRCVLTLQKNDGGAAEPMMGEGYRGWQWNKRR